jgi:threonine dehydratase
VVEREDVIRARETVERHLNRTPLLTSRTLGARLKCELFQRTGSFKPRGALNKIASLTDEEKKRGVIAISAGNHAQAVAFAAGEYGIDALVVMWSTGSEQKREATKAYGATVDLESTNPAEAFTRLEELMAETGRTLVHPFDDPTVIAGAGTVGLEVEEDAPDADVIVVPVGGGGLVAGIKAALADSPIQVIAVEPETSPALHDGLAAGKPVPTTTDTIADGLNAPFAGALPIEICRGMNVVLVTEQEIEEGFRFLYERAKLACEPAGAAGAAAILAGKVEAERPVVVVTGGNVAARTASGILGIR